jgi:hypothetical protein
MTHVETHISENTRHGMNTVETQFSRHEHSGELTKEHASWNTYPEMKTVGTQISGHMHKNTCTDEQVERDTQTEMKTVGTQISETTHHDMTPVKTHNAAKQMHQYVQRIVENQHLRKHFTLFLMHLIDEISRFVETCLPCYLSDMDRRMYKVMTILYRMKSDDDEGFYDSPYEALEGFAELFLENKTYLGILELEEERQFHLRTLQCQQCKLAEVFSSLPEGFNTDCNFKMSIVDKIQHEKSLEEQQQRQIYDSLSSLTRSFIKEARTYAGLNRKLRQYALHEEENDRLDAKLYQKAKTRETEHIHNQLVKLRRKIKQERETTAPLSEVRELEEYKLADVHLGSTLQNPKELKSLMHKQQEKQYQKKSWRIQKAGSILYLRR